MHSNHQAGAIHTPATSWHALTTRPTRTSSGWTSTRGSPRAASRATSNPYSPPSSTSAGAAPTWATPGIVLARVRPDVLCEKIVHVPGHDAREGAGPAQDVLM